MTSPLVKRLVLMAVLGTSAAMLLMLAGILYPSPMLLVLVMSIGQGVGIMSLALFLLAVTLDIQGAVSGVYDYLPASDDPADAAKGDDVAPSGPNPGA